MRSRPHRAAVLLADPTVQAGLREKSLAWLSAGGFVLWPDEAELSEIDDEALLEWAAPILHGEPQDEGFSCGVNGIILGALPHFLPLIAALNEGGPHRVGSLLNRLSGESGQPEREELREALQHLGAARAFTIQTAQTKAAPADLSRRL